MVWQVMFINRLKGAFKMSSNIVLDVRRVEKNYNTTTQEGKENIYSVLKGISFQVHKGEFISIMGSSGCGKTTLLKIIGMLNEPSKGTVLYKGKNIQGGYKNEENSAGRYGSRNRKPLRRRNQAIGAGGIT